MTKQIDNTIVTVIEEGQTAIRTGVIEKTEIGMVLVVDEQEENTPIIQLQFNKIEDIDYIQSKLNDLKKQMEIIKNEQI